MYFAQNTQSQKFELFVLFVEDLIKHDRAESKILMKSVIDDANRIRNKESYEGLTASYIELSNHLAMKHPDVLNSIAGGDLNPINLELLKKSLLQDLQESQK